MSSFLNNMLKVAVGAALVSEAVRRDQYSTRTNTVVVVREQPVVVVVEAPLKIMNIDHGLRLMATGKIEGFEIIYVQKAFFSNEEGERQVHGRVVRDQRNPEEAVVYYVSKYNDDRRGKGRIDSRSFRNQIGYVADRLSCNDRYEFVAF